jgi:hypothetical protein
MKQRLVTVNKNSLVAEMPPPVAMILNGKDPPEAGVPLKTPVLEFSCNPGGGVSMDQA